MAVKDWQRVGKNPNFPRWVHKKPRSRKGIEVGKWDKERWYFEFWDKGRPQKRKFFKNKPEALKYILDYRRKH